MEMPDEVEYLELSLTPEEEAKQPPFANYFNVNGAGDTLTLDFFYLHPNKEARLFEGKQEGAEHGKDDGVVSAVCVLPPAARVVLPVRVALDLIAEMLEQVVDTLPDLQESLNDFGHRMGKLIERSQSAPQAPSAATTPTSEGSSDG